jgi:hypothetical protein
VSDFEEGMDFEGQFHKLFATESFASSDETQKRLKRERKASQTPKQRRKVAKKQINFRATSETEALIKKLAGHLDKSVTDVIALAVEALAKTALGGKA